MSFLTGTQAELLYSMPASGNAVTGTVTSGTAQLLSQPNSATAPAFFLPTYFFPNTYGIGKSILIQGGGTLNNGAATQSMTFNTYFDTTVGTPNVKVAGTGATTGWQAAGVNNYGWSFDILCTCTAVGTSGTLNCIGKFHIGPANNAATAASSTFDYIIGGASATINTSTSYAIDVLVSFGATTTSQTITMTNFLVWGLN